MQLQELFTGNYRFLPGITPYSAGVVAVQGFELVHVCFDVWLPYREGFDRIAQILSDHRRPKTALCAVELRSPDPFTFARFAEFNASYIEILRDWGLFVNGVNPVARTNVVPERSPPREPVLHAFSFTKPTPDGVPPTFVVSGAGELPEGRLDRSDIVALGDTSVRGLRRKADFVVGLMEQRLASLGMSVDCASTVDVYTVHDLGPLLSVPILSRLRSTQRTGVEWHYARPPIVEIEFEMDLRGVRMELRI